MVTVPANRLANRLTNRRPFYNEESSFDVAELQDPELLKEFIEEAKEHLSTIEINMLGLETNPEDTEAINAVFRPFHSIKGVAGFLNLTEIHHLSHEVENLLDSGKIGQAGGNRFGNRYSPGWAPIF